MRALALALLATGCGRWHFDAGRGDPDAGDLDAEGTCDAAGPFGTPVPIASLDTSFNDGTLRLTPDELRGYFWSYRSGRAEIYEAHRRSRTDSFVVGVVSGLSRSPGSPGRRELERRRRPELPVAGPLPALSVE